MEACFRRLRVNAMLHCESNTNNSMTIRSCSCFYVYPAYRSLQSNRYSALVYNADVAMLCRRALKYVTTPFHRKQDLAVPVSLAEAVSAPGVDYSTLRCI